MVLVGGGARRALRGCDGGAQLVPWRCSYRAVHVVPLVRGQLEVDDVRQLGDI